MCNRLELGISRRKSNEEFVEELAKKCPTIEALDEYVSALNKIRFRCKIDGSVWSAKPSSVLYGYGCKVCGYKTVSSKLHRSFDVTKQLIEQSNQDIEVIEELFQGEWKVRLRCKVDGYEWIARSDKVIGGDRCARCSVKEQKTHEKFIEELSIVSPDIDVISTYQSRHQYVRCRCKKAGHEWNARPGNLLQGTRCPHCFRSIGEQRIAAFLDKNSIEYVPQKTFDGCKDDSKLLFDFYVPSKNAVIEYDGQQHFYPVKFGGNKDDKYVERFEKCKAHDEIKNKFCRNNGISILRIPYTEFENIEELLSKMF